MVSSHRTTAGRDYITAVHVAMSERVDVCVVVLL